MTQPKKVRNHQPERWLVSLWDIQPCNINFLVALSFSKFTLCLLGSLKYLKKFDVYVRVWKSEEAILKEDSFRLTHFHITVTKRVKVLTHLILIFNSLAKAICGVKSQQNSLSDVRPYLLPWLLSPDSVNAKQRNGNIKHGLTPGSGVTFSTWQVLISDVMRVIASNFAGHYFPFGKMPSKLLLSRQLRQNTNTACSLPICILQYAMPLPLMTLSALPINSNLPGLRLTCLHSAPVKLSSPLW